MQIKFKMPLLCICLKFMRHACIAGSSMLHLPLYYVRLTEKPFARDSDRESNVRLRAGTSSPDESSVFGWAAGADCKGEKSSSNDSILCTTLTAVSIKIITRVFEIFVTFCVLFSGFCDKWRKLTCLKYRAGHIHYLTALVVVVAALVLG